MEYKTKLKELILTVIRENGSDLHLNVSHVPAIRVSGELIFLTKYEVLTSEDMLGILSVVLDKNQIDKFKENKEIDFAYSFQSESRLRGNAFFQKGLISVVFRLVLKVQSLKELNLPKVLNDIARKKQGFFCCGESPKPNS